MSPNIYMCVCARAGRSLNARAVAHLALVLPVGGSGGTEPRGGLEGQARGAEPARGPERVHRPADQ